MHSKLCEAAHRTIKQLSYRCDRNRVFCAQIRLPLKGTTNERRCSAAQKTRTLFISDVHLGSKAAQAELLLDFLRYHEAETIYLVGILSMDGACGAIGIGRRNIMMSSRSCFAKAARARISSTSPATTTNSCEISRERISAASK